MTSLQRDDWLSRVLARECFQLNLVADAPEANRLDLLPPGSFAYAKVPVSAVAACNALESTGFRMVDTGLTFEGMPRLGAPPAWPGTREARPADSPAVAEIAAQAFRFSRFHLDPRLDRADANRTRREWATNYFTGRRGDAMIVSVDESDRPTGFLQLLRAANDVLVVDLIAVAEQGRRQGAARAMLSRALAVCGPVSALRVGTQAANIPSVRLYESLGLKLVEASYALHWHSPRPT
ncbi:MAG: GNAT family N-acetyltransferase [Acetobacterales bacterium]